MFCVIDDAYSNFYVLYNNSYISDLFNTIFYIKKFDNFVLLFKEFKYIHNTIFIS